MTETLNLEMNIILGVAIVIFVVVIILVVICMVLRMINSSLPAMMLYSGGSVELASRWFARWEEVPDAKSYHCVIKVGSAEYETTELSNITQLMHVIPGDYGTVEVTPFDDNETPLRRKRYYVKIPESPFIDRCSFQTFVSEDGLIEATFNASCSLFVISSSVSLNNSQPYKFTREQTSLTEHSKGNWKVICRASPFGPLRKEDKVTFDITIQNEEGADSIIHSLGVPSHPAPHH